MEQEKNKKIQEYKPTVVYSIKENQVTIHIDPVDAADGYEVYTSKTKNGKYSFLTSGTYHILSHYLIDDVSRFYKVRAYSEDENGRSYSLFSQPELLDLVTYSLDRTSKIESFFDSLKSVTTVLTNEDLDIAIDSLKLAGLEIKEHEERKKLEENAEKIKREIDLKNKRKQLRAEREEAKRKQLEIRRINSITTMELPADYENSFIDENKNINADNTYDALLMSLDTLGMVDIEFISSLTNEDLKTVISNLRGSIYQNPSHWGEVFYKGWETADEYLSGNLMHKYQIAKEANEKYNGYFESNLTALSAIIEPITDAKDIYITLGSPWVPTDIIDLFIIFMAFKGRINSEEAELYYSQSSSPDYLVRHDEYTGCWEIPNKTRFRSSMYHGSFDDVNFSIYGTDRMDMLQILENTLNMKTIAVYDTLDDENKTRVINQTETLKAIEKQKYMIKVFQKWVWKDEKRKARLEAAYARKYGNFRKRYYDGQYLKLPGLNPEIKLFQHQKNAIARILSSTNTLLAHDVGAGKTYTMICAGMELRRLKKSKKNLYVVPNNIITQWSSLFKKLYPNANLLIVTNKNFGPKKRSETINKIKNNDYDAILMTYSCFDMLSPSKEFYYNLYLERKKMLEKAQKNFYKKGGIEKKIKAINETLSKIQESYTEKPLLLPFDELGINTLFLDEAHNYKNINLDSKITMVRGIAKTGSSKANCMLDKVRCIQRMNNGGRIVFATGTPITNSISDIYVMQRYLQEGELFFQNILTFDAWVAMFAEKTSQFEIDIDTNNFRLVTRFSKYRNIPELASTLSSIIDFHQIDKTANLPNFEGYIDSVNEGSDNFKDFLKDISNRADDIHKRRVSIKEDNMLKLTTDGRKAALDMRLIDTAFGLEEDAKVLRCATNIADIYEKNPNVTQLVFCDSSTPKESFNLYDELKKLLSSFGIPKERIAFIHDATSDQKRYETFNKMNNGNLSVLIGSTSKMGHGMNVQKRLYAIHHLDVPWRPSDMVQREGRILRQGNENKNIQIYRYITKASFDAYSWQLLENKQRFISQIMSGKVTFREGNEIDDSVLNYAEVKALAIGNPLIKSRVEITNELNKAIMLRREYLDRVQTLKQATLTLPGKINEQKQRIQNCIDDYETYLKNQTDDENSLTKEEKKDIKEIIYAKVMANQNSPNEIEIMNYKGFRIVVPAYMIPRATTDESLIESGGEKRSHLIPYIHLVNKNTYLLEIESKAGILARLNNFFKNMPKLKEKYEGILKEMENKLQQANYELQNNNDIYIDQINKLEEELSKINKKLGME